MTCFFNENGFICVKTSVPYSKKARMSYNEKYLRKVEWKINDLQVKMQTVDEKHLPRFVVEIERLKIRRAELQDLIEHEKTPRRAVQHSDIPE